MASSLSITDEPTLEHPVTLPPTRGPLETRDNAPFDQERWDAWVAKGRRADAASTEKVRMLAVLGVTIGVVAGAVWIVFG